MSNDLLNILGGNVSSEASDIVLGALGTNCGFQGICRTDDGTCLTNCTVDGTTIKDIGCLEDTGLCPRNLILCPSDTGLCSTNCTSNCSWNCNNDCVTDGLTCTDNIIVCDALSGCRSNCTSVGSEISTDAYLYTQFGKGTSGSALCTTKSRAVSLGLSVTGSYSDTQLVPKNKISIATASTMDIMLLVYLNNTSVVINTGIYSPNGTSYLVPSSYATTYSNAKTYLSSVGNNNIFNLYTNSSYLEPNYNLFWGYFRMDNSIQNSAGAYTVGQLNGTEQLGELEANSISVNRTLSFTLELRMKNGSNSQGEMAALIDTSNTVASIRATGINLNVTPYGVELPSSQSSNCEVSLSKTSYTLTNGKGYYSGNLYLNLLYF